MACVFVTGSTDGLGRAAAETLLERGHEVVVHARSDERLAAVRTSGGYWRHQRRAEPAPAVKDEAFQDRLLAELARFTGERRS